MYGGGPVMENYGRYVLISQHDLDLADRWFARYGEMIVFSSRLLPVIRTFIAFPAGVAKMNMTRFVVYTFLGSLPWCLGLAYVGQVLGEQWDKNDTLKTWFHSFEIVTTLALLIGVVAINVSKAGVGVTLPAAPAAPQITAPAPQSASDIILHIFPENIAKSIAEGQVLQIVVFSILFGIALALVKESKRQPVLSFCESLSETMFKFTNIVMMFAPVGVGAAIAYTVAHMGLGVLVNLFKLLATLYAALLIFIGCVLVPVAVIARVPIREFAKAIVEPVSIAFATTSSEAALPRAMEQMERIGVPRQIVAFVIPTGYSFNLDGSSLYLSLASIFVAQVAGIQMSLGPQLLMVFTLMLTSKGVAGVPRAALVILLGTVASFHLPAEPVFIILGIDELMDMARTSVNVLGNCLASVVIARWEGQFKTESRDPIRTQTVSL